MEDTGTIDDPNQTSLALNEAADLAEQFEGFSPTPYQDSAGVWTIGFGSIWTWANGSRTGRVTADTPRISPAEARSWMVWELLGAMRSVMTQVSVPLTTEQRAALTDFTFNLGSGNLAASTLLRRLNAGDYEGAAQEFAKWNRAGGVVLAGLVRRRAAEQALFDTPEADAMPEPAPSPEIGAPPILPTTPADAPHGRGA